MALNLTGLEGSVLQRRNNNALVTLNKMISYGDELYVYTCDIPDKFVILMEYSFENEERLIYMVNTIINDNRVNWPEDVVMDKSRNIIGCIVNSLSGYQPLELSLKNRIVMDTLTKEKMARLIISMASIVQKAHENNIVIGNLTLHSFAILKDKIADQKDGNVALIECLDVQIGKFLCKCYTDGFLPPECDLKKLFNNRRDFSYDDFTLFVCIFKILFKLVYCCFSFNIFHICVFYRIITIFFCYL